MDKLWVRLSIAFSSMVLLAVCVVLMTGMIIAQAERFFNYGGELGEAGGLVEALSRHYRDNGSWNNVEPLLRGAHTTFQGRRFADLAFILADANKQVIYHPRKQHIGTHLGKEPYGQVIPIKVDNELVGYLAVGPSFKDQRGNDRPPFGYLSSLLLTFALVIGVVGIIFGILVSRSLTAPLNTLAASARAIGARNLSHRVAVKGSHEMKEVALAFNEMATDLEQAEQLRRNLIADVAHELRTPLSVLQGNLRAILDDVYPLEKSEMTRLYDQTRLLGRLVNDLHELAQAEARQLPLNLQDTDLPTLITSVSETFSPLAEEKGVTLQAHIADNLPLIQVDAARLTQVFNNLVNNGLRHTPAGGTISVDVQQSSEEIRVAIADNGEGISPQHLPHIFDRFYRADPARSRDKGGAGLGLAIARAIIEAHDGRLVATSTGISGEGSTFTVWLPVAG